MRCGYKSENAQYNQPDPIFGDGAEMEEDYRAVASERAASWSPREGSLLTPRPTPHHSTARSASQSFARQDETPLHQVVQARRQQVLEKEKEVEKKRALNKRACPWHKPPGATASPQGRAAAALRG